MGRGRSNRRLRFRISHSALLLSVLAVSAADAAMATPQGQSGEESRFVAAPDGPTPVVVHMRRRLDYIFSHGMEGAWTVSESGLFGEQPYEGRLCSDHFGIYARFTAR